MTDFTIIDGGSVWTITAVSDAAKKMANERIKTELWQGPPTNFTTDWRAARDLALRLQNEGWDIRDLGKHY